ncbi:uracil-xanthine permease family protein [Haloactinomyces albus]
MIPFGLQHVLVMAATPISSVFLVSKTLGLSEDLTVKLLAAAFVFSGVGTLVQSLGPGRIGVRLPFVMLPGGAPIVLFVAIAQEHGLPTASGAVILTAVFYLVALPLFTRLLKFFPTVVIGTMIVIIGVNLIKVGGLLVTGKPGTPGFGDPRALLLGLATIGCTVLFFRLLTGMLRQLAVVLGLVAGTVLAALLGATHFDEVGTGPLFALPEPLPFGPPEFSLIAAVPLMLFALASMAEATGQTVLNGEIVGKDIDTRRDAPKTIRGDALVSLCGGLFGTSLMVTSGENVGIVRVTGVRSRFVTVIAGIVLVLIGLFTPIAQLMAGIPAAVVGGTALVVFAVITVLGIQMLRQVDLSDHTNIVICAVALALGLLPILVPGIYDQFPANVRILLDSGVAVGAFVAAVLNVVFHHLRAPSPRENTETAAAS